jgi:hypothetical protein
MAALGAQPTASATNSNRRCAVSIDPRTRYQALDFASSVTGRQLNAVGVHGRTGAPVPQIAAARAERMRSLTLISPAQNAKASPRLTQCHWSVSRKNCAMGSVKNPKTRFVAFGVGSINDAGMSVGLADEVSCAVSSATQLLHLANCQTTSLSLQGNQPTFPWRRRMHECSPG